MEEVARFWGCMEPLAFWRTGIAAYFKINDPRHFYLCHAEAEWFSPPACQAVVEYWRKSNAPDAAAILAYWQEVCSWLEPPEAQALFSPTRFPKRSEDYLELSGRNPLAAAMVATFYNRGPDRYRGWMRYTGPRTRLVVALQCLAVCQESLGYPAGSRFRPCRLFL
jgi:hypothetical protein